MDSVGNIEFIVRSNTARKMLLISGAFNFQNDRPQDEEKNLVRAENTLLAEMVAQYPDRLFGFCGLDPLKGYFSDELRRCINELGLHGVKLHLPISRIDLNNVTHVLALKGACRMAATEGIPLLIHNLSSGSGTAYAQFFIQEFFEPNKMLTVIFAHAGGGSSLTDFTINFLDEIGNYMEYQNRGHEIFFELSGIAVSSSDTDSEVFKHLADAIERIGTDRFLFGSDFPMRNSEKYLAELSAKLPISETSLHRIASNNIFDTLANHQ